LRRADLDSVSIQDFQKRLICSAHFDDSAYMYAPDRYTTSRLKSSAIPTIWNHGDLQPKRNIRKPPLLRTTPVPPYLSSAATLPSTISGDNFDNCNKKVGYNDCMLRQMLCTTQQVDWLNYLIYI